MSRQAQNVLTGAIACVAATIAVALVILTMAGDSDELATGAVQPLSAGDVEAVAEVDGDGEDAVPARRIPVPPDALAVTTGGSDATGSSATDTSTGTPLDTSRAPTSATTSAVTQATTGGSSSPTAAGTGGSATTVDAGSSSTTAGASTSGSTVTSTSETTGRQTTTTASRATTTRQTTATTASTTTTAATSTSSSTSAPPAPSGSLNAIEREIARLTNELRTNPNGSLKRQGPAIDCGGRVRVDLSTGLYESIGAVTVSEVASLQVARPWSAQMTRSNFEHQPNAGVAALQAAGISVRSAGENIAYHNYPDKAMNHFTGWRESDGHFCNMMNPGFTHLGIGEVTKSDGISYATQNFYSTG